MLYLAEKEAFLENDYIPLLEQVDEHTKPLWGKMDFQQMVEHMGDHFRYGCAKVPQLLLTHRRHLPKMVAFMESERRFPENTPNELLPDYPIARRWPSKADAIARLQTEVHDFLRILRDNPQKRFTNPWFGYLTPQQSIQILHKHAWHHLRQFGVEQPPFAHELPVEEIQVEPKRLIMASLQKAAMAGLSASGSPSDPQP